jgi:predicted nuclease with TOPRIM domain
MEKEKLVELRDEAENKCRELYDQLETVRSQANQIEIELERTRGDFRTYGKLLNEWVDDSGGPNHVAPPIIPPLEDRSKPKKEKLNV